MMSARTMRSYLRAVTTSAGQPSMTWRTISPPLPSAATIVTYRNA